MNDRLGMRLPCGGLRQLGRNRNRPQLRPRCRADSACMISPEEAIADETEADRSGHYADNLRRQRRPFCLGPKPGDGHTDKKQKAEQRPDRLERYVVVADKSIEDEHHCRGDSTTIEAEARAEAAQTRRKK